MDTELREQGLAELRRRAFCARLGLAAFLLLVALSQVLITAAGQGYVYDAPDAAFGLTRYELVDYAYLFILFSCYVMVALWIWQAHRNIHDAGFGPLEFTPGWAVGWFAVPIASFFKPFQAMRELWHASMGEGAGHDADAPPVLWVWWIPWVLGNMLAVAGDNPTILIVLAVLDLVAAVSLWLIITRITAAQHAFSLSELFG